MLGQAEKVGPEFGFRNDDKLRAQGGEVGAHGEGEVQGKIKNIFCAEALGGELLSGVSSCRNYDAMRWKLVSQRGDDAARSHDLSDRNGVNPDGWLSAGFGEMRGDGSEALTQTGAVFAVAHHLEQPVRQRQE